jgi:subtilisin family serine protease
VLVALVVTGLPIRPPVADARPAPGPAAALDPSLLVRFRAEVPERSFGEVVSEHGAKLEEAVDGTGFYVVSTGERGTADVERDLAADPRVMSVEPNHVRSAFAVPNDPYYASAQASYLEPIRLPAAWDVTTGADDLVLAVVDSGVDLLHPDLEDRLLPGRDFVNDDDSPDDDFGHGTQVATIAAASTDNRTGLAGVAWRAKVLPVKVLDRQGRGTDADIAAGITWAVDHGADVINLSFGGPQPSQTLAAAVDHARSHNVVIVSAAGNAHAPSVDFPADLDGVIAVSATDRLGNLAWFSNYGPGIDVAAPGIDVLTGTYDGPYRRTEGTSFAAPIVAGIALLTRARFPGDAADAVIARIRRGARDAGPLGIDDYFGYGIVDALATVGGPPPEPRIDASAAGLEPDNTPDRASPLSSGISADISAEGDVDWFYTDVPSPRALKFSVAPPTAGGARRMDAVVEVFGPAFNLMRRVDEAASGGREEVDLQVGTGRHYLRVSNLYPTASPGPTRWVSHQACRCRSPSRSGPSTIRRCRHRPPRWSSVISPATVPATSWSAPQGRVAPPATTACSCTRRSQAPWVPLRSWQRAASGPATTWGWRWVTSTATAGSTRRSPPTRASSFVTRAPAGCQRRHCFPSPAPTRWRSPMSTATAASTSLWPRPGPASSSCATGEAAGSTSTVNGDRAAEIELADVNHDGRADVVAYECPNGCQTVAVYTSQSGGGFTRQAVAVASGAVTDRCALGVGEQRGTRIMVGCSNGAGIHDLVRGEDGSFRLNSTWGPGSGTFDTHALDLTNIDGEGDDDVLVLFGSGDFIAPDWGGGIDRLGKPDNFGPKGMAVGDVDNDGRADMAVVGPTMGLAVLRQAGPPNGLSGERVWVRDTTPADGSSGAAATVNPTLRFVRPLNPTSVTPATVTLTDGATGATVPAGVSYDPATHFAVLHPTGALVAGRPYLMRATGVRDTDGNTIPINSAAFRFMVGSTVGTVSPPPAVAGRSGYWMVGSDGAVYGFGDASYRGGLPSGGSRAVDLEPAPSGGGYWILDVAGHVFGFDAPYHGGVDGSTLQAGESVTSLSATPSGAGYWIFTTAGRVFAFGDATHHGDMGGTRLNGPVLDSIVTPSGGGYYMVASDGGIFSFGDARFFGSMGGKSLNAPVQSLVPDPDRTGYWLVASDGGVFSFDAAFRGSMGSVPLNRPVTGMVPFGNGYLMVAEDGGIFNFSDRPFHGSLGANPPRHPVVAVAAIP